MRFESVTRPTLRHADLGYVRRRSALGRFADAAFTLWARHCRPYLPRVVLFHRIVESMDTTTWGGAHPRAGFTNFLDYLCEQQFEVVRLDVLEEEWNAGRLVPDRRIVGLCFDDGTDDVFDTAWPLLKARCMSATVFVTTSLIGSTAPPKPWDTVEADVRGMNESQLRELDQNGVEIACHGHNHYPLTRIDDGAVHRELAESKGILEGIIGHPVKSLSYPHGAHDDRVRTIAAAEGYRFGWGCDRGPLLARSCIFGLPRCGMPPHSINWADFDCLMWDGELVRRLRSLLRPSPQYEEIDCEW